MISLRKWTRSPADLIIDKDWVCCFYTPDSPYKFISSHLLEVIVLNIDKFNKDDNTKNLEKFPYNP